MLAIGDVDRFRSRLGPGAATALAADLARHPGPKHGLLIGASGSPVLEATIDALRPDDALTVVAGDATSDIRDHASRAGDWVERRVRVRRWGRAQP